MKEWNREESRRDAGFTLVEILLVVVIIGILAAVAIPNLTGAQEKARQNAAAQGIRKLESAVDRGGKEIDELFYVSYYPSGRCEGYSVTLADGEGRRRTVTVDPITGKAKVKDG